jgi:hypothetical protein
MIVFFTLMPPFLWLLLFPEFVTRGLNGRLPKAFAYPSKVLDDLRNAAIQTDSHSHLDCVIEPAH